MSTDLYWLTRRAKDLPRPIVKFIDNGLLGAMGSYWGPRLFIPDEWRVQRKLEGHGAYIDLADRGYIWLNGEILSTSRGVIAIDVSRCDENDIAACLAHEWRHHWQAYNAREKPRAIVDDSLGHEAAMVKYFSENPKETDALRFEVAVAPDDVNLQRAAWLGWSTRKRAYSLPTQCSASAVEMIRFNPAELMMPRFDDYGRFDLG